jgi:hypothetical protein
MPVGNPPVAPSGAQSLLWQIEDYSDPGSVTFNVSVDVPSAKGRDYVLFTVVHGQTTPFIPPKVLNPPDPEWYKRGFYISSVNGASSPFFVKVLGGARNAIGQIIGDAGTIPIHQPAASWSER